MKFTDESIKVVPSLHIVSRIDKLKRLVAKHTKNTKKHSNLMSDFENGMKYFPLWSPVRDVLNREYCAAREGLMRDVVNHDEAVAEVNFLVEEMTRRVFCNFTDTVRIHSLKINNGEKYKISNSMFETIYRFISRKLLLRPSGKHERLMKEIILRRVIVED